MHVESPSFLAAVENALNGPELFSFFLLVLAEVVWSRDIIRSVLRVTQASWVGTFLVHINQENK